jgi:hypothetical protein
MIVISWKSGIMRISGSSGRGFGRWKGSPFVQLAAAIITIVDTTFY